MVPALILYATPVVSLTCTVIFSGQLFPSPFKVPHAIKAEVNDIEQIVESF